MMRSTCCQVCGLKYMGYVASWGPGAEPPRGFKNQGGSALSHYGPHDKSCKFSTALPSDVLLVRRGVHAGRLKPFSQV